MTFRDRYLGTLLFEKSDRVPLIPGEPRESTLKAWRDQSLPEEKAYFPALLEELGLPPMPCGPVDVGVSFKMIPPFEEKVLEHKDGHYIVQDWTGAITEISDTYDYTYIRSPKDFVTRKWHRFPVQTRADWKCMRERFYVDTPGRLPGDLAQRCRELESQDNVLLLSFNGPFWQLREWCGLERLCILLVEDPEFVREMIAFWTDFVSGVMCRVLPHVVPDEVLISEDMAYKAHSMISPHMAREFLLPVYRRWVRELRAAGCRLIHMDSDGYIAELIPIWIEAGINACSPIEVAAENDIVSSRKQFGRQIAFYGGIDKRAIAAGSREMEAEVMRVVPPLLKEGGLIPSCDHGVPPDISWRNYVTYARCLARLGRWL